MALTCALNGCGRPGASRPWDDHVRIVLCDGCAAKLARLESRRALARLDGTAVLALSPRHRRPA